MRNYLIFDGKNLADFGVWISGTGTANAPSRSVETIPVPGRNGTLTIDNGCFENATVQYPAFIRQDFARNMTGLRTFLGSSVGYQRLEDTYYPDEFRLARPIGELEATPSQHQVTGRFTLKFDCKPQRFLKIGEQPITVTSKTGHIIRNPGMESKPLLICHGTGGYGSITISYGAQTSTSVSFVDINGTITLDCETMNAYSGTENKNSAVSLQYEGFPTLMPGDNSVSVFGAVTKVEIVPRWWVL